MSGVIVTHRVAPSWDADIWSVRCGEWEESYALSNCALASLLFPLTVVTQRVYEMADRVALFDRLVREDRDW